MSIEMIKTTSTSWHKLVEDNIRLVHHVVTKKFNKHQNEFCYEDYYAQGCVGLVRAAKTFDDSLGVTFAHYSIMLIRNEIIDNILKKRGVIRPRRSIADYMNKYIRVADKLGEGANLEQIASLAELSMKQCIEIHDYLKNVDIPVSINENDMQDWITNDESYVEYSDIVVNEDVRIALDKLDDKYSDILKLRFIEEMEHSKIATTLNISKSEEYRRLNKALDKIKLILGEDYLTKGA